MAFQPFGMERRDPSPSTAPTQAISGAQLLQMLGLPATAQNAQLAMQAQANGLIPPQSDGSFDVASGIASDPLAAALDQFVGEDRNVPASANTATPQQTNSSAPNNAPQPAQRGASPVSPATGSDNQRQENVNVQPASVPMPPNKPASATQVTPEQVATQLAPQSAPKTQTGNAPAGGPHPLNQPAPSVTVPTGAMRDPSFGMQDSAMQTIAAFLGMNDREPNAGVVTPDTQNPPYGFSAADTSVNAQTASSGVQRPGPQGMPLPMVAGGFPQAPDASAVQAIPTQLAQTPDAASTGMSPVDADAIIQMITNPNGVQGMPNIPSAGAQPSVQSSPNGMSVPTSDASPRSQFMNWPTDVQHNSPQNIQAPASPGQSPQGAQRSPVEALQIALQNGEIKSMPAQFIQVMLEQGNIEEALQYAQQPGIRINE